MAGVTNAAAAPRGEGAYAWMRLMVSLALMTIGGVGMYSITVVLPRIQSEFAVTRGDVSLAYTLTMIGFGVGGIAMGKLSDRFGVMVPVLLGTLALCAGFVGAGYAGSLWAFSLIQGFVIGFAGTSATFSPLVADTSMWFTRKRGIARDPGEAFINRHPKQCRRHIHREQDRRKRRSARIAIGRNRHRHTCGAKGGVVTSATAIMASKIMMTIMISMKVNPPRERMGYPAVGSSSKIGRSIAITMNPTKSPMTRMMMGSMNSPSSGRPFFFWKAMIAS